MNKIKFYLIDCPTTYIGDMFYKMRMNILDRFRKRIYNYEYDFLNHKICDPVDGTPVSDLSIGVLSPVLVVTKIMENHFGFKRFYRLNIHGIYVDTQKEDNIIVTVLLRYPGLLIGKAGQDIDSIEEKLSQSFGKNVTIEISAVKNDINLPRCDY